MLRPPRSRAETTVAVIGAPTLFAESVRTALELEGYPTYMVSAQVATVAPEEALGAGGRPPYIAILDLDLAPGSNALTILRPLAAVGTHVLVVTATEERTRWAECLGSGAARVLRKTAPLGDVLEVVGRLEAGLPVMSQSERDALIDEWQDRTKTAREVQQRFARLDDFESWVLTRLIAGYAMHEIAREGPSHTVVNRAVASVVDKLEVPTWVEAVDLADEHSWSPYDAAG